MTPTNWQRVEGGLVFLASVAAVAGMNDLLPWWAVLLLFLAPDLGFAGYLAGPRAGAAVYNALHLYGVWLLVAVAGQILAPGGMAALLGLLWVGHVGFDRMLGYGLKEITSFSDTHLGRIGRR